MDLRCFFGTFHKVLRSDGVVELPFGGNPRFFRLKAAER
jgi:hypothetical protein